MQKLLLLASIVFLSCLSPRWVARPIPKESYKRCEPLKSMPQMTTIPDYPGVWQVVDNCEAYPREKTSIAISIFLREWRKIFGNTLDASRTLEDLTIFWQSTPSQTFSGYSAEGIFYSNVRLRGATMSDSWITIYQDPGGIDEHIRICESALIHEIIHAIIWKKVGNHGDPDHLGSKYRGWTQSHEIIIQNTNQALCTLGI